VKFDNAGESAQRKGQQPQGARARRSDAIPTAPPEFDEFQGLLFLDAVMARSELDRTTEPAEVNRLRRNFVRAVFAYFEGSISWMESASASLAQQLHAVGRPILSALELCALRGEAPVIRKGAVEGRPVTLGLGERLWLATSAWARVLEVQWTFPKNHPGWARFQKVVGLRNGLAHPRTAQDLVIHDEQLHELEEAKEWFHETLGSIPNL